MKFSHFELHFELHYFKKNCDHEIYRGINLTKLLSIVSSKRAAIDDKAVGNGVSIIGFASVGTEAKNGNLGTTTGLLGT